MTSRELSLNDGWWRDGNFDVALTYTRIFSKSVEKMKGTGRIKYSVDDMRKMKEIFREQLGQIKRFQSVEEMQRVIYIPI